jgi:hypothetical protein
MNVFCTSYASIAFLARLNVKLWCSAFRKCKMFFWEVWIYWKTFVLENQQYSLLSKCLFSKAICESLGIFIYGEGTFFECKFLLLHKNQSFPFKVFQIKVVPLVVILSHCFKVQIFNSFLTHALQFYLRVIHNILRRIFLRFFTQ